MLYVEVNFRVIKVDVVVIKDYALKKNCDVNVFVEHDVDEIDGLVDVHICVTIAQVVVSS